MLPPIRRGCLAACSSRTREHAAAADLGGCCPGSKTNNLSKCKNERGGRNRSGPCWSRRRNRLCRACFLLTTQFPNVSHPSSCEPDRLCPSESASIVGAIRCAGMAMTCGPRFALPLRLPDVDAHPARVDCLNLHFSDAHSKAGHACASKSYPIILSRATSSWQASRSFA